MFRPEYARRRRVASAAFFCAAFCAMYFEAGELFGQETSSQVVLPEEEQREAGVIIGQVTPKHDHAFTLATARIPDLALRVRVEKDGSFEFRDVRPGNYLVEVRVPTLGTAIEAVIVVAGEVTRVDIEVIAGSHFDEVVVSAPGSSRDPLELATAVTSLSGQELQLRLESSLGETLSQEAGVSSTFFGPGASRPIIRGLGGDRIRVLEDGIGTGDASAVSADHAVSADPVRAERIEVLRGPATLLYGSSAVGGVVNVIDERIPTSRASSPLSGTADVRSTSVSDERLGAVNLNGGGGDWAWHVDAMSRETNDYEVPGKSLAGEPSSTVLNSDIENLGGRVGATRFFGDDAHLGISASALDGLYGIPSESTEEAVRVDMEQRRIDLRGEVRRDLGPFQALELRAGVTDYEHSELEGGDVGTIFRNDSAEARIELTQKKGARSSGSVGLQYLGRELDAIGDEAFIPRSRTSRWALFSLQEIDAGPVRWQIGGRFETQDVDASGVPSRSHDGLSASLGLVWDLSERWSLGASLARSVKLPAPEELFSDGVHVATQTFEVGSSALGVEVGTGLDVSLRRNEGRVTGELTLFRQDFDDFIFQALTGEERSGFPEVVYSQADAEFLGAELEVRVELFELGGHHVHLALLGDLVEAQLASSVDFDRDLPRIPPRRFGAGLHYHSENWSATVEVRRVDSQTAVAVNEAPTDGYTLVGASVGRRFLIKGQILDLLLRGRNLLDEEARSHTSFLKAIAPLPGRDVTLSLRYWF